MNENTLIFHYAIEFHYCRFSGTSEELGRILSQALIPVNPGSWEWSEQKDAFQGIMRRGEFFLKADYYPHRGVLLLDIQDRVQQEDLSRHLAGLKKALSAGDFTLLEMKRGRWIKPAKTD